MPLIDDRARLFGRVNVIDAIVGVVVLALIPLGYGAFRLFRVPVPTITSIQPQEVIAGEEVTLQVTGQDLRPFLRARIGPIESSKFAVQSPTLAEVRVPRELSVGIYDLTLYDEGRELVRKAHALTVLTPPPPPPLPSFVVQVVGAFIGLSTEEMGRVRVGSTFPPVGADPIAEVLAAGEPEPATRRVRVGGISIVTTDVAGEMQVPAIIRLRCQIANDQCKLGDTLLAQDAMIVLPVTASGLFNVSSQIDSAKRANFFVTEVRSADARPEWPSPPPATAVQAVGMFIGVSTAEARVLRVGSRFRSRGAEPIAEILAVSAPERGMQRLKVGGSSILGTPVTGDMQVPAILLLRCVMANDQCRVGNTPLAQDTTILLPGQANEPSESWNAAGSNQVRFFVTEVRSADARLGLPRPPPPPPSTTVQALGAFVGLSGNDVRLVRVGAVFPGSGADPVAEILALGAQERGMQRVRVSGDAIVATPVPGDVQVQAIIRLRCQIANEQCTVGNTVLVQDATIALPVQPSGLWDRSNKAGPNQVSFFVKEVRPVDAPVAFPSRTTAVATVRVRFVARPEIVNLVNVGDIDVGSPLSVRDADRASLTAVEPEREMLTAVSSVDASLGRTFQLEQTLVAFNGTVRVPVVLTRSGWQYKDKAVKVGVSFAFETTRSYMEGTVLDMTVASVAEVPVR